MFKKLVTDIERFWTRVEHQENGCWLWTGAVIKGYGGFKVSRKMMKAHRFIWEHLYGSLTPDVDIHHVCENPLCVNPEHLEKVSRREHMLKSPNNITYALFHQTHCHRGHEFTPENTYTFRGGRQCRECQRLNQRNYQARRKAR